LPPAALAEMGYKIALYPVALLAASIAAMADALAALKAGRRPERAAPFAEIRDVVGFDAYRAEEDRYAAGPPAARPKRLSSS